MLAAGSPDWWGDAKGIPWGGGERPQFCSRAAGLSAVSPTWSRVARRRPGGAPRKDGAGGLSDVSAAFSRSSIVGELGEELYICIQKTKLKVRPLSTSGISKS